MILAQNQQQNTNCSHESRKLHFFFLLYSLVISCERKTRFFARKKNCISLSLEYLITLTSRQIASKIQFFQLLSFKIHFHCSLFAVNNRTNIRCRRIYFPDENIQNKNRNRNCARTRKSLFTILSKAARDEAGAYTHCDQTTVTAKTKLKSLNIVFFRVPALLEVEHKYFCFCS